MFLHPVTQGVLPCSPAASTHLLHSWPTNQRDTYKEMQSVETEADDAHGVCREILTVSDTHKEMAGSEAQCLYTQADQGPTSALPFQLA